MFTDCIEADGPRDKDGYVRQEENDYGWGAHREAWEKINGPIPKGMYVCHHCDNPPCINVAHLFLGTNQDNQIDYFNKNKEKVIKNGRQSALKQWENPEFREKMMPVLKANGEMRKGKPIAHDKGFGKGHPYYPGRWK